MIEILEKVVVGAFASVLTVTIVVGLLSLIAEAIAYIAEAIAYLRRHHGR